MRSSTLTKAIMACLLVSGMSFALKGLLEKKLFYSAEGKNGEAVYWAVYFGDYTCNLMRKFPGEPEKPIEATLNVNMLSSGYVEARGFSAKGKIDAVTRLFIKADGEQRRIEIDDVDFVYDGGLRVRLTDGTDGELLLNIDGNIIPPKMIMIRKYRMIDFHGEKTLKEDQNDTDKRLTVFSFSKEGFARAMAAR